MDPTGAIEKPFKHPHLLHQTCDKEDKEDGMPNFPTAGISAEGVETARAEALAAFFILKVQHDAIHDQAQADEQSVVLWTARFLSLTMRKISLSYEIVFFRGKVIASNRFNVL